MFNQPSHAQHNLLANSDFEEVYSKGIPSGWSTKATKQVDFVFSPASGYAGGKALSVTLTGDQDGSLDIMSPVASVDSGKVYLYKGYYKSAIPFSLLVKHYYKDGGSSLQLVRQYSSSEDWTTNSTAFKAGGRTSKIQLVYRVAAKGTLWLDKTYLDQRNDNLTLVDEPVLHRPNLINNNELSGEGNGPPAGWSTFSSGNNEAQFTAVRESNVPYLRTRITAYQDGDAEWNHAPIAVEPGQYMQFSVEYRSDAPVRVTTEYALDDRKRLFVKLMDLPPASEWTRVQAFAEAPARAVEATMNVVLEQNGTLETGNYVVRDFTRQGQRQFKRPLVSIAFDDAWASSYHTTSRIMDYLGYKTTYYFSPDSIGEPSFLNDGHLNQLIKSGNQLASSGNERIDLTTLNARQLERHLRLAQNYFMMEFGNQNIDFAPWYGHYDHEVQWLASKYYRSSLSAEEGTNTKQNLDVYNLKTLYVDRNMTLQRFQAALDDAARKNGWVILVYHRVQDGPVSDGAVSSKAFADQMELVNKNDITVKTVEDALSEVLAE